MGTAITGAKQPTTHRKPIDRRLRDLIILAVIFSAGHHIDHIIRGNHLGWPLNSDINAFTYSLAIYPLILTGWALYRAGKVGPGFWLFLSGGGALFVSAIHFGPWAIEPRSDIIDLYQPRVLGWIAFAWLVVFVGVLLLTSGYEYKLWSNSDNETPNPPNRKEQM